MKLLQKDLKRLIREYGSIRTQSAMSQAKGDFDDLLIIQNQIDDAISALYNEDNKEVVWEDDVSYVLGDVKRFYLEEAFVKHRCKKCGNEIEQEIGMIEYGYLSPYYYCDACGFHSDDENETFNYDLNYELKMKIYKEPK